MRALTEREKPEVNRHKMCPIPNTSPHLLSCQNEETNVEIWGKDPFSSADIKLSWCPHWIPKANLIGRPVDLNAAQGHFRHRDTHPQAAQSDFLTEISLRKLLNR